MSVDGSLLALVPAFPLLGAILIALLNRRASRVVAGTIASAMVGLSALLSFGTLAVVRSLTSGQTALHDAIPSIETTLWTWMDVGGLVVDFAFRADPLAAAMMCVVCGVGFLIHVYSIGYMDDPQDARSTWRFFAYLNLFVFSMLLLVMGSNFLVMFVGWEGVGLCSYLLIGFWFQNSDFAAAGKKAFVTNRVGDFCFVLGLFWLFWTLGENATLDFRALEELVARDPGVLGGPGSLVITGVCLLLFGGATGKSAQIPLFVWLPDAMAGPTPVSALIHAATMVTAGVYMVCRLNFLFALSPVACGVVATVGALTALFAATIALTQNDIKKVLAYSTVSQLGYMFVGAGIGAYTAGFFHVVTHAFFKALLFLGAGSIIHALHHEQDLRHMGGLRKHLPGTFLVFTAAWLAIIGFPGTAGFFSKDEILWLAFATPPEQVALFGPEFPLGRVLWGIGVLTAGLTAFYMSRLYFLAFFGELRGRHAPHHDSGPVILVPLGVLALASLAGGALNFPHWLPSAGGLHSFLEPVFEHAPVRFDAADPSLEFPLMGVALAAVAAGVGAAWFMYVRAPATPARVARAMPVLYRGSYRKWFVDEIYGFAFIRPLFFASRHLVWAVFDAGIVDGLVNGIAKAARATGTAYGRQLQVGNVQVYALAIASGTALLLLATVLGT